MKFNSTFIALSVSALLFSGMASAAITGTPSVELTIKSKIVSGTCTAKVLSFTNCSGVTKATVSAAKGAGGECSGVNKTGDSYSGGLATGFEIWSGVVDTGELMSCNTPPAAKDVTITDGTGEFPMNSRIVIGQGQTIADVGAGAVTAPVTFTIAYP